MQKLTYICVAVCGIVFAPHWHPKQDNSHHDVRKRPQNPMVLTLLGDPLASALLFVRFPIISSLFNFSELFPSMLPF